MAQSLDQVLLSKLLDICKRWANRALPLLLKPFSVIGRLLGLRRSTGDANCTENIDVELTGKVDDQSSECSNGSSNKAIQFSPPNNHEIIVAYSSIPSNPSTPPPVHTRYDSSTSFPASITGTLFNTPGLFSEHDGRSYCSAPMEIIRENSIREDSITDHPLRAVPAQCIASPGASHTKPLKTISPSERPRYDRNITIKSNKGPWIFEPLATFDVYRDRDVLRWKHYVHPEGPPYYLLERCDGHNFSYLTEADLQDCSVLQEVGAFVRAIETYATNFNWSRVIPGNVEVVLEIEDDAWSYYMIDLEQRCVFWLHKHDVSHVLGDDFGVESLDHFRYQLDFEFWQHIEYFPNHRQLYPDIFDEVMGILNYWRIDVKSSAESAAPYDANDLDTLVKSVKHLHTIYDSGNCAYAIASVARIMSITGNERYLNFYGFNGARVSVLQTVRGNKPKKRSTLIKSLSPLLFNAPETHLSGLERLWVDGVIRDRRWKKYQEKLERDWESFVLTSTVLLNANVALLSTPIILSNNGDARLWASPAAVASQVSIVASIASIVIGLLLVRQIRISSKDIEVTASDTVSYLHRRRHKQLGLETIAIQYSLPYALLMWGVITFLASIAIACFFRINGTPNIITQIIYAVSWLFAIPLILWTVLTGWETNNRAHWSELLSEKWWKSTNWPWCLGQKRGDRGDIEAIREAGMEASAVGSSSDQLVAPAGQEAFGSRNWRVRVKNFGPIRRLTRG